MRLYGNDMDETTTLLEAGLGWIVGWDKPVFNGKETLVRQKADGLARKLVGFEMLERGIARHGYDVYVGDHKVGLVTSGTRTPFLKKAIGMAYVPVESGKVDSEIEIDVRGRRIRAPGREDAVLQAAGELSGMYPPELKYTKDHEWIRVNGDAGQIGITDYAQRQLGDVVFVELPKVGSRFQQGDQFGSIESVKAVSDLYCRFLVKSWESTPPWPIPRNR